MNRVRVHRWLPLEPVGTHYHWFDLDKSASQYWSFDNNRGCWLWDYSTDVKTNGQLTLSCGWERDVLKNQPYFQLVLLVCHREEPKGTPPSNVLFKIPLEPGRLCDAEDRLVYVRGRGGKEFKAGDLEIFPYEQYEWKSDEDKHPHVHWHLSMETFHTYL
jgi:hypothetical protein